MSKLDPLEGLHLQPFQERTVRHVYDRMINGDQSRFLIADEVGLGKTRVAQGVIALAIAQKRRPNVLYLASSGYIVGQNLNKLRTPHLEPHTAGSLCLLAAQAGYLERTLIGLTPIKDLREDHFGSVHERALVLKLLSRRHRSLSQDRDVREFFRGSRAKRQTFDYFASQRIPGPLRDLFEERLDPELIAKLEDPGRRKNHKRQIVGGLRAVLARCALERLKPTLVIVDEIQRFSDRLLTDTPTPQVEYLLKQRLLMLSATPYQPGARGDHAGPDPHRGFLELIEFLNHKRPTHTEKVRAGLAELSSALMSQEIDGVRVQRAVNDLGDQLREIMVRTERPYDAHVQRVPVPANLQPDDLKALRQAMDLLGRAPARAGRPHRWSELVELWKSTPYVVSALSERYVTGRALEQVTGSRLPAPASLTRAKLRRKKPLGTPEHPRLRALADVLGADLTERRLWLPPTVPYVRHSSGDETDPPSKTLIFTSWAAAPPAIATTLNLMADPRARRSKDLEFARRNKSGYSEPVRSVYLLGAPLWRFAHHSDPFLAVRAAGEAVTRAKLIAHVRGQLVRRGVLRVSRGEPAERAIDTALRLNAVEWGHTGTEQRSYLGPAHELMRTVDPADAVALDGSDANFLAELATAAPGTCAYRALCRTIPGITEAAEDALLRASFAIGNTLTRLFQRPSAAAIVDSSRWNPRAPYWRRVLRFCLEHDLQSVLDEYLFVLAQDSTEKDPGRLAYELAEAVDLALSTVGALSVARPKPEAGAGYGAASYARALGDHESQAEETSGQSAAANRSLRRRRRQANPLLAAFNSPFPPFVLATTSTGQEGLDMHRYCRRLVHWNLPTSPLALEQREGRVDRYLSLGVRTNIAGLGIPADDESDASEPQNVWRTLLDEAKRQTDHHASPLAPLWHFGASQPIKALAMNIPFSREETAWERLLEEASWYRLVLGQQDPHALLERLANASEENRKAIAGIKLDLSPPTAG